MWAQDELERLRRRIKGFEQREREGSIEDTDTFIHMMVEGYDYGLPRGSRIQFKPKVGERLQVYVNNEGALEVYAPEGFLFMMPRASNVVQLKSGE